MDEFSGSSLAFDLKSLSVFIAVAETPSMTVAARRLGISQPAISQTVARLEKRLGVELLTREARGARLTAAGEELARRGRRLLTESELAQVAVREAAAAILPSVRIGLVDSFAATAGPALIRRMRNHAERISVWSGISSSLNEDLLDGKLDMVIANDPLASIDRVQSTKLLTEPYLIVVPAGLAKAGGEIGLDDLARNHPFVRYSLRSRIGAQIERYLEARNLNVPASLEFDGTDPVFAMVAGGIGWAITTPLCLVHGRAMVGALTPMPLSKPAMTRSIYLVTRKGELGGLPGLIAEQTKQVLAELIERDVRPLADWAADGMSV